MTGNRPCITLTDNGSLRPAATMSLRRLAKAVSESTGETIHPVSLLHSNKIPSSELDGIPADTLESFWLNKREEGIHRFLVLPLFFGPSAAIAEYLPQRVDALREERQWEELEVRVAPCLVDCDDPGDQRLPQMLATYVEDTANSKSLTKTAVALVDHGTPRVAVTRVRDFLAEQLAKLLDPERFHLVRPCSMERREGSEYDFNEPLLERLLGTQGFTADVVVSMLFLQPGRHAGEGGDVATICKDAEDACPGLRTHMTALLGDHPDLLAVLIERLHQGRETLPVSWAGSK